MPKTDRHSEGTISEMIREVERMMPCTALFYEAMGKKGNMDPSIKPLAHGTTLVGSALTVRGVPGDNLALHLALNAARPGQVIVADFQGHSEYGYWGEFMSRVAMSRYLKGLVINGGVRDVDPIKKLGFKVFARGVSVTGTTKRRTGAVNETVMCGGIRISPGDLVLGDDDGVVVIPFRKLETVLKKATEMARREKRDLHDILSLNVPYQEFLNRKGWHFLGRSSR